MGKRSRRRRQRRKRRNANQALARVGTTGGVMRVQLMLRQLEMARGYDGLLRGMPEPTLVVGVYRVLGQDARSLGRYLYRFERPTTFPTKVGPQEESNEAVTVELPPGARVLVLVLAVEEDSGRGLQTLFGALEQGESVMAWSEHGSAPVPMHLPELAVPVVMAPDVGHRIHLMLGEIDPSRELSGDDWVDANLVWTTPGVHRRRHRLHFVSADARNDWTAEVEVALRMA